MKRLLLLCGFGLTVVAGVLIFNTWRLQHQPINRLQVKAVTMPTWRVDPALLLSAFVQNPTISRVGTGGGVKPDWAATHRFLQQHFPLVHQALRREVINRNSLLYTWRGRNPALKPVILIAHLDVVPAPQRKLWRQAPFSGARAEGFIWGRGTLDDKTAVISVFTAMETLLGQGFAPERDCYLVFGHDEETGGSHGAAAIAELLRKRLAGNKPLFILDEWSAVMEPAVFKTRRPVALVGVAEKGLLKLKLSVTTRSGHASRPDDNDALSILLRAIQRIQGQSFVNHYSGPTRAMLESLAPDMSYSNKLVLANPWLFETQIENNLSSRPATRAMLKTTVAVTVVRSGGKENVTPGNASARLNIRIHSADSVSKVKQRIQDLIADKRVRVSQTDTAFEPSAVSPLSHQSFLPLARSIREVFPRALIAPSLLIGASDSRHFRALHAPVYRFRPYSLRAADINRIHGQDERISLSNLHKSVLFYYRLFNNVNHTNP